MSDRELFIRGAFCQGGHSEEGAAIAEALGVPFPLTMDNLEARAIELGYDTRSLWPWLYRNLLRGKRDAFLSRMGDA